MTRRGAGKPEAEGGFLDRWSRRKREAAVAEPEPQPEAPVPAAGDPEPEKPDAELLAELDLPDPDGMKPGDDFSAFMQRAVPRHLRNRALRKLWLSNPVLANLDGLNDYDGDYTDAATVVPGLKTAYKVGRGFWEPEDDAPEAGAAVEADASPGSGAGEPELEALAAEADASPEPAEPSLPPATPARAPSRTRMKFRVAED